MFKPSSINFVRVSFWLLILALVTACATNIAGRKQLMLISESSAIQASRQAYAETLKPLEKEGKLDNNPVMVKRIQDITDRLVEQAVVLRPDTADWEWTIRLIDDPESVNAWAMAGGKMAIYTGLIEKLKATDDEIAQVMAHEISHALANHSAERMSIALANNMALSVYQSSDTATTSGVTLAAVAAQVAITLPNSRTSETEADELGIKLAAMAGYDPRAAVSLWQKMRKASGNGGPEFLRTHPSPKNREQNLQRMIPQVMQYYRSWPNG